VSINKKGGRMSNNFNMQMEYRVKEILYDYWDKVINEKQLYEYLKTYGYTNKQIKELKNDN
tara:strand:+ start:333 stop:515 length:183 start_codon:yes stop_codon:yes gene_type:complete